MSEKKALLLFKLLTREQVPLEEVRQLEKLVNLGGFDGLLCALRLRHCRGSGGGVRSVARPLLQHGSSVPTNGFHSAWDDDRAPTVSPEDSTSANGKDDRSKNDQRSDPDGHNDVVLLQRP